MANGANGKFTSEELYLIDVALTHYIQTSKLAGDNSEHAVKQRELGNQILQKIEWPADPMAAVAEEPVEETVEGVVMQDE